MAFTVILDAPGGGARRLVRGVRMTLGVTLRALGWVAAVPAFLMSALSLLAVPGLLSGQGAELPPEIVGWWWPALWTSVTVGIAATAAGARLVRGQRRLALFLRRFRRADTTDIIAGAAREFGLVWRLVTLDDREVRADGLGRAATGFAAAFDRTHALAGRAGRIRDPATVAGAVGALLMLGAVIALVGEAGDDDLLAALLGSDAAVLPTVLDWTRPVDAPWILAFRVGAVSAGAGLLGWAIVVLAVLPASAFGVFEPVRQAITAAEAHKVLAIGDRAAIGTTGHRISRQSAKLLSPRLFVIRVDSSVWREAVLAFADAAAVPLIDVTEPSDHVLWELQELVRRHGDRVVLVGELQQLGRMFDRPRPGMPEARLLRLLDGRQVLGYTTDPAGRDRFARALRVTLDRHAGLQPAVRAR